MRVAGVLSAATLRRVAVVQVALALSSIALPSQLRSACLLILSVTAWLLVKRLAWGEDAADQMSRIVLVAGALAGAVGSPKAQVAFLWFTTAQLCIAYLSAGVNKLIVVEWRHGDAIVNILSTDAVGRRVWISYLLGHRNWARTVGWVVVGLECTFPLVLAGQVWLTYLLLLAGIAFHVSVAVLMRLNTFLFAFLAAYPAVAYCSGLVR